MRNASETAALASLSEMLADPAAVKQRIDQLKAAEDSTKARANEERAQIATLRENLQADGQRIEDEARARAADIVASANAVKAEADAVMKRAREDQGTAANAMQRHADKAAELNAREAACAEREQRAAAEDERNRMNRTAIKRAAAELGEAAKVALGALE